MEKFVRESKYIAAAIGVIGTERTVFTWYPELN